MAFAYAMDKPENNIQNIWLYLFIVFAVFVNFTGLFIPIIGPDGTLYALIAKTMVLRNDYVDLFAHGKDWLDKPHFPFWITAFSFKLFGFKTWAYKLPGILFLLMGAFYTYLFARQLYNKQVALWSVLILLTAQHIVLSNNDVRAEPYLTGLIIAGVYHFYLANKNNNYWQILFACLFTACAIMTKGMFALVPIGGALAGHLIITKRWKALFNLKWLLAIALVLLFILPEVYCLYLQFDSHPEKVIFGEKAVSGIKFFFWDSQFGRFFNTGPIKGHGDPTFFIHTALWAFLPWSLLMFVAVYQKIKGGIKNIDNYEWYCLCAALLTFLLFSASKFQLPHYLNIVFPFFAIITANYLNDVLSEKSYKAIRITQMVIITLMLALIALLYYFFRPETLGVFSMSLIAILFITLFFLPGKISSNVNKRILLRTLILSFIVNLFLNFGFYPSLMHYQGASEAGIWISKNNPNNLSVVELDDDYISAFEFYTNSSVTTIDNNGIGNLPQKPFLLYAPADMVDKFRTNGWKIKTLNTFERYWVSRLKPSFLNENTRQKELTKTVVALVQ